MKKGERQRERTQRDSINQGINRVVINVSSARGYGKYFRRRINRSPEQIELLAFLQLDVRYVGDRTKTKKSID